MPSFIKVLWKDEVPVALKVLCFNEMPVAINSFMHLSNAGTLFQKLMPLLDAGTHFKNLCNNEMTLPKTYNYAIMR